MPEAAPSSRQDQRRHSPQEIRQALALVLDLPVWWLTVVFVAAALSCAEVRHGPGGWAVALRVTGVTGAILAATWLPSLVSLLVLAGGSAKTPAGEFATGGLLAALASLPTEAQREVLPPVVAALDTVEGRSVAAVEPQVAQVRDRLEERLAALPVERDEALGQLARLARDYEDLRREKKAGPDRTYRMTLLLTRARALGSQARLTAEDIQRMLAGSDGERIMGIAVAQGRPDQADPDSLLEIVHDSHSAFEQYAALEALLRANGYLTSGQRRRVVAAIRDELSRPGTHISPGTDRYGLARALLTSPDAR